MATVVRKPKMNRVYVTGDIDPIRQLLSDFHARYDSTGAWLPIYQESNLRSALKAETEYQTDLAKERSAWETAKAVIPHDYRERHGAALGGDVRFDGEVISEPALDTSSLPWTRIARFEKRVRDLTGTSSINGRVMDSEVLYSAVVADGRTIYRIASSSSFGDDLRETYYLPYDLWQRMMLAEIQMRGITPEKARQWLSEYRGCVGTELYEFASAQTVSAVHIAGTLPASV